MLKLFRTKTFLKEYRKIKFTDKLYLKYVVYITTLLKEESLPQEAKNHPLTFTPAVQSSIFKASDTNKSGD